MTELSTTRDQTVAGWRRLGAPRAVTVPDRGRSVNCPPSPPLPGPPVRGAAAGWVPSTSTTNGLSQERFLPTWSRICWKMVVVERTKKTC